jgi:uncharacterized membrane protein (DUF373 family)
MSEQISEPNQPVAAAPVHPEPEPESKFRAVTFRGFELIADILHLIVGALLVLIAAAVIISVVLNSLRTINPFDGSNASTNAVDLVDKVLFVVIVLELLDTVLTYLRDRTFALRPFLIIGIISSVRHILITGAKMSNELPGSNDYQPLIELGVSAVVALLLVICYWIVGKTSDNHAG